jgi:hypothetical protein
MRSRGLAPWLLVTSLLSSCAVAGSGQFAPIDDSEIPLSLSQAATTTVASTTTTTIANDLDTSQMVNELVDLYFILGAGLLKVQTNVVSPASPSQALLLLGSGPLNDPSYAGLRSAIPQTLDATVELSRGVATVTVPESFLRTLAPSDQRLAIAQIVATLTSRPGIGQVSFVVDDAPIAVPRGRGDLVAPGTPVTFDDYAMLIIGG